MSSSKAPGSLIGLTQLHEGLQQICSNLIKDLEKNLQTTELPITIDRDVLAFRIRANLQSSYHVVSNNTQSANQQIDNANTELLQGLGSLIRLPREIRELVYAELIPNGSVSITAVSKIINMETAEMVSRQGVFRTNFGFQYDKPAFRTIDPATSSNAKRVQNVEIRINSKAGQGRRFSISSRKMMSVFAAPHTSMRRKRCSVELDLVWDCQVTVFDGMLRAFLEDFKSFTGFGEIVFFVATKAGGRGTQTALESLEHWECGKLLAKQRRAMHFVETVLIPAFGEVVWRMEERGMAAYFHPQVVEMIDSSE